MAAVRRPGGRRRSDIVAAAMNRIAGIPALLAAALAVAAARPAPRAASGCVRIREWSPLERGSETKWYARGVGLVRARPSGGGTTVLVSVTRR